MAAVGEAQIMEPDEDDGTPRENGQQSPQTRGDPVEWSAVEPCRGQTPPGYNNEWTISTISRRFAYGERAADVVESPTGEKLTLGEPRYVTVCWDRFPDATSVTAEYEHHVFPDIAALESWFADEDQQQ